jgi:hypothetical protein
VYSGRSANLRCAGAGYDAARRASVLATNIGSPQKAREKGSIVPADDLLGPRGDG